MTADDATTADRHDEQEGPIQLGGALIQFPSRQVKPCPATTTAVLGMVGPPADVRCGLLEGHAGRHRMSIEWADQSTTHQGGSH